jgi:hypothetical protein
MPDGHEVDSANSSVLRDWGEAGEDLDALNRCRRWMDIALEQLNFFQNKHLEYFRKKSLYSFVSLSLHTLTPIPPICQDGFLSTLQIRRLVEACRRSHHEPLHTEMSI